MTYKLTRSKRKTIAILIRDGQVEVKAPFNVPQKTIDEFVDKKTDWIQQKLNESEAFAFDWSTGIVRLWGNNYHVVPTQLNDKYEITDNILFINSNYPIEKIEASILKEERHKLDVYLSKKVEEYARLLNIPVPTYTIRKYKRLYGRCNSRHELGFNIYLIKENQAFIDYVVLHECCHIVEFNHSKRFYKLIEDIMPKYKEIIKYRKIPIT